MIVIVRLAFLAFLLCPVAALGQSRFNVCTVLTSWWDNEAAFGTSNDLLGQFKSVAGREPLIKSVKDADSGLFVTAGVRYDYDDLSAKESPFGITLAVAVSGKKEEDVFELQDNVEAGASYGRGWGSLNVIKKIAVGSKIHRFVFSCRDAAKLKKWEFPLLKEIP